jgi:superfamily II DNA or RNA helicase
VEESFSLKLNSKKALALLKASQKGALLFSEGTYQIEIFDRPVKETFWPFFQLDDQGKIVDCFCTCKEAEKKRSCPHLAAAYLKIFNKHSQPLHLRFRDSLWNQLCQIASRRHGYDRSVLGGNMKKGYRALSITKRALFYVRPLTPQGEKRLLEIIASRPAETEETSLKFSNLSQQELLLWREGRPSYSLRFELSFWSDLAKWWMLLQERGEPCKIAFRDLKKGPPRWVVVRFDRYVEARFYIAQVNWSHILPALKSLPTPIPIHEFSTQSIRKIIYDKEERALLLDVEPIPEKMKTPRSKEVYELGEWIYVPKEGFFSSGPDPIFQEKKIPEAKIASVLNRHVKTIRKYLSGTEIHEDSIKPSYVIEIDARGRLSIELYLFEPGDLQGENSAYFGPWVYLEGRGFYLLDNPLFSGVKRVLLKHRVADFIQRHRHWLNNYEGFQTHLSTFQSHLTFSVTPEGVLHFDARLDVSEELGELIDFGEWIYLKGRGFYAKMSNRNSFVLKPGLSVPREEVSHFIWSHREELHQIQGFFALVNPLEDVKLRIFLNESQQIVVSPQYLFKIPERASVAQFFGDFIFIPGLGFSEIPSEQRLPLRYVEKSILAPADEPYFLSYEIETLAPFISSIDSRLQKPEVTYLQVEKLRREERGQGLGWIFEFKLKTEIGEVALFDIWHALQTKKTYLFSPGGLIFLHHARFHWLKNIGKKRWLKRGRALKLSTLEWIRLNVFEEVREPIEEKSRLLLMELNSFHSSLPIQLDGLESHLRSYQEVGVRWLWFLYTQGLSGLLCDEMGLGKTHQAMGLIAAAMNHSKVKILVVTPTSVIYHWEELLKRFLPKVRVSVFYGVARTLETFAEECDLLLTSYGTLRSEKAALARLFFEIAIFDEVQIAKNSHSQTHRALRKIDAKMRLGLTGTPIENRLLELKALFDLILPSYLPTEAVFRGLFINPIEKYQDVEKRALLSKLIKPFILRRKKSEVLLELPEKIEEISYCTLSPEQKELYQKALLASKEFLLTELNDMKRPPPLLHIFALLTTLKRICDHPTLITKQFDDYQKHASGKWELFVELLEEAHESGQKVVVFSQYLEMLDLIERYLREKGIGFAGIRGSTRNRKGEVERFSQDPHCLVFVASLQAAGVGIDLIAASVVIHYDRWWNPAKENQATDRVHRMGQSRGVQVFKLVTKGTIEEHIHNLIEKKRALERGILLYDDQEEIKQMNRSELIELLSLSHL